MRVVGFRFIEQPAPSIASTQMLEFRIHKFRRAIGFDNKLFAKQLTRKETFLAAIGLTPSLIASKAKEKKYGK